MKPAYEISSLHNLLLQKEAKGWHGQGWIDADGMASIKAAHPSSFYHPNFAMRILLLVATAMAWWGAAGFMFLFIGAAGDEKTVAVTGIVLGVGSLAVLESIFIAKNHHYKSGVNEALLYLGAGSLLGGILVLTDPGTSVGLALCFMGLTWCALRYLDLISTIGALICLVGFLFNILSEAGPTISAFIPLVFAALFTGMYLLVKKIEKKANLWPWADVLLVLEGLSLVGLYLSVNYMVVRELSIDMMGLVLEEGQDIPLAIVFYLLTAGVPVAMLWLGIRRRDIVLLRVSLLTVAFAAFTFRYYFSLGHPEVILTLAGALLIGVALLLFKYLKEVRGGFTREPLVADRWKNPHLEAFVISQTMGGNASQPAPQQFEGGGGQFGGGGASGDL